MPESVPGFLIPPTSRWPLLRRSRRLAGTALLAAILVACGGSDSKGEGDNAGGGTDVEVPVDTLASFKQQTLNWQACDPSVMEDKDAAKNLTRLGERAQCALMRVPLDYANPSSAELQIEILQVAAEQKSQKLGAIVLNSGGPGEDDLSSAPMLSVALARTDRNEAGALLQEMSRRYDLVAFSPRGMGRHSPLHCELIEERVPTEEFLVDPRMENLHRIQRNARLIAQACATNPWAPHIHTEATARDMDLLRGLLGEEKLNYIGYSYGTWLGSWYAGLFPERVGHMLFDSSMDITGGFPHADMSRALAEQRVVDEVMLPYAARHPERFGLGNDPTALRNRLLALSAKMKSILHNLWDLDTSGAIHHSLDAMAAAVGVQDFLSQKPQANWYELEAEIKTSPAFAVPQVAEQARYLFDWYFGATLPPTIKSESRYWSVICNDVHTVATEGSDGYWNDVAQVFATKYPFAMDHVSFNPCLYWNRVQRHMPTAAEIGKAGPLLMLQSRYDSATPIEGAQNTLNALPKARMIVVENEYQHSIFPYGTACVDEKIARYFLQGQLPERISSCAGKALGAQEDEDDDEDDDENDA